ncbi:hypothetical protein HDU79_000999 [Rhizoclosmatium sp. JEL0117]|nr:hypothetical protein HDU79_000999 [Rhizoclosmatium sp. JEL0117]
MQFLFLTALIAAVQAVDLTATSSCGATNYVPSADVLYLPDPISVSGSKTKLAFPIPISKLFVSQTLTVACGTAVDVQAVDNNCVFTFDTKNCAGSQKLTTSAQTQDQKKTYTASKDISLKSTGTSTAEITTVDRDETGTVEIVSTDVIKGSDDKADVTVKYDIVSPLHKNVFLVENTNVNKFSPSASGEFTVKDLACGSEATNTVTFFSCESDTAPSSGSGDCSTQKSVNLKFKPAGSDSCSFSVDIQNLDYALVNEGGDPVIGGTLSLKLGDDNAPQLIVTKVSVTQGTVHADLDVACYKDYNSVNSGNLIHGDTITFNLGRGSFPTSSGPLKCPPALAIFSAGTYTVSVDYKIAGTRRRDSYGSSKLQITVPESKTSPTAIAVATVGSVAAVALIAVGAIVIRRRNLQKRAAAIKESEVLVAQEFVASA